jgi:hypothetical protein
MLDYFWAMIIFLILVPVIFISALVYHHSTNIVKKVLCCNFSEISKVELWLSLIISILISAILSYSVI